MAATISKYGNIGFEVVKDGRQVGLFRVPGRSELDRASGRSVDAAPTEEDFAEARRYAEAFVTAIS